MSSVSSIPPLRLVDPSDDPEHYEFVCGRWRKKESVGRKEHSQMGRVLYRLLRPPAHQLGCEVEQEWTVVSGDKKIIPDVTVSLPRPEYRISSGYLVAPALLAIESRSQGQALQSLVDKCTRDHDAMGTRYCWIVDIERRAGYECHLGHGEAAAVPLLAAGDYFSLPVSQLFEEFDREA